MFVRGSSLQQQSIAAQSSVHRKSHAVRVAKVFFAVFLIAMMLPLRVLAQAPAGLVGTGYAVGDTPYDFTGPDQDMNQVSLYQYYGRYTVLAYDAVWCGPSNYNAKQLGLTLADLAAKGLPINVVSVLLQGNNPAYPSTQTNAINWSRVYKTVPVIHMNGTTDWTIYNQFLAYSVPNGGGPDGAIPTVVVMNPHYKIIYVQAGALDEATYEQMILNDLSANLAALQSMVQSMNLKSGLNNSLMSYVTTGSAAFSQGKYKQVHNAMADFMTLVNNQTGKGLTADQAAALLDQASLIDNGVGY